MSVRERLALGSAGACYVQWFSGEAWGLTKGSAVKGEHEMKMNKKDRRTLRTGNGVSFRLKAQQKST